MPTNFPGGLDNTSNLIDNANDNTLTATTHATAHNNIADAIIAVETALGMNPEGSYASVAAWLAAAVITNPGAVQTITPTADAVALRIKQGNSGYTSDLQEWLDSTGAVKAYIDKSGNFSAQGLKINGTALSSAYLSDGATLQKKGKIAANIAASADGLPASFDIIQGVTPGRVSGATPQNTLQVTTNSTFGVAIAKGCAHIQGTDDIGQSMYGVVQNVATTLAFTTIADATNPRIDAVVIQYNDSNYTARTPADTFSFVQVAGTATPGATLTNLSGAPGQAGGPSLPASCVLLAYALVPATALPGTPTIASVQDERILSGPAVWGEDNHKYRLAVDATGNLFLGQVS